MSTSPSRTGPRCGRSYLVGCDGGRSLVRKAAGIDFVGFDPSTSFIIAEADMAETSRGRHPARGRWDRPGRPGVGVAVRTASCLKEARADRTAEPTLDELRAAMIAAYGTDFGLHSPTRISHFTDVSRQAVEYRKGRVLLAGDAAHIHAPLGGQGLNTGVQDAVNLGWKLARVVKRESPDSLLDTYHAERHPVGARVLDNTMAQTALVVADDRHKALHAAVAGWLALDEPRKEVSAMISGLDIRYDTHDEVGGDHPLVGRRMPDLDVHTAEGPTRVFALLHTARPVLLNLAAVRRLRRLAMALGPDGRCPIRRPVGASGDRPGRCAHSSADPPRRLRCLDRRLDRLRPAASPDHMVRSARLTRRPAEHRSGGALMGPTKCHQTIDV